VVVGSQDGVVTIFSWGDWADMDDRFLGKACCAAFVLGPLVSLVWLMCVWSARCYLPAHDVVGLW
jgi:hypothetical protein